MDLFLVNGAAQSRPSASLLLYAGVALLSIYGLAKLFGSLADSDQDHPEDSDHRDNKPVGIYNEGNTCFVNSVLQALSSLQSFQKLLKNTSQHFRGALSPHEEFIVELSSVLDQINNASESISVSKLLSSIEQIKQGLINFEQQDAHELYTAIISCVDLALNRQKNIDLSASARLIEENQFENPLIGYLKSSTICTTCKAETSVRIDPFYDLSLDISKVYVTDIASALADFQRDEKIDHWTCSACSIKHHCHRLRKAVAALRGPNKDKLAFIGQAIIQFLQSEDLEEHEIKEVNYKLENLVREFERDYQAMEQDPERDSIFIEMEGQQSSILKKTVITKYPKILVIHLKQLVVHPYTGQIVLLRKHIAFQETLTIAAKHRNREFVLTGMLTHIGTESFGHYMSFRRANRESRQWYVMNDSMSQKTSWGTVQQSRAYMLFYQVN